MCCFPEVIAGPNSIQASGGPGIHVTGRATGNVIQANYVGTSPAWGDFAHAAGNGAGIRIDGSSSDGTKDVVAGSWLSPEQPARAINNAADTTNLRTSRSFRSMNSVSAAV